MKRSILKTFILLLILISCVFVFAGCDGVSFNFGSINSSSISSGKARSRSLSYPEGVPSAQDYKTLIMNDEILIIDVSSWTGSIDFQKVKEQGADGVIMRLGRHERDYTPTFLIDQKFIEYYTAAKAAELPVGCYFFAAADDVEDAEAEAAYVLELIDLYGLTFELPVFYDVEDKGDEIMSDAGRKMLTSIVDKFCGMLCQKGYLCGYYASRSFADDYLNKAKLLDYPFWIADWTYAVEPENYPNLFLWQYTSKLSLDGVEELCDGNRMIRDLEEFTTDYKNAFSDIDRDKG